MSAPRSTGGEEEQLAGPVAALLASGPAQPPPPRAAAANDVAEQFRAELQKFMPNELRVDNVFAVEAARAGGLAALARVFIQRRFSILQASAALLAPCAQAVREACVAALARRSSWDGLLRTR